MATTINSSSTFDEIYDELARLRPLVVAGDSVASSEFLAVEVYFHKVTPKRAKHGPNEEFETDTSWIGPTSKIATRVAGAIDSSVVHADLRESRT